MEERKKRTQSETSDRHNHLVLLVDDAEVDVSSVFPLLERFGYFTLKATSCNAAIAALDAVVPSLIIIGLDFAKPDALELLRHFKKNRSTSHIPLISITRQEKLNDRCLEHGAAACLSQPIEIESLFRTVQAAVEKNPRESMRIQAVLPVKVFSTAYDHLYGAYTLAISAGGMFLRTMNPISVNTEITLQIDLNGQAIPAETVVVYNCQDGGGPYQESGIGLRFVEIAPKDQDSIRQFVMKEVMKGISCEKKIQR